MRVLYLANAAQISGGNRVLLELWASLPAEVTPIVACPEPGALRDECERLGIECHVVPYTQPEWRKPFQSLRGFRRWTRVIERARPDVVHANDPRTARSVLPAARWTQVPVVCHVHFPPSPEAITWSCRGLPKPAAFLYCSHALAAEVQEQMACAAPRAAHHVVQNAIALESFPYQPRAADGQLRVTIVANLIAVKGHVDFLAMAQLLKARHVEAGFWIVGDEVPGTGYRSVLESRAAELGLTGSVQFLGRRRDIADLLALTDVLVCASYIEPFGMCLLEAMATGRAVVATRVGGIVEVVEDGKTGLLVPPGAPAALADAVARLLGDGELRDRMGAAGRRRVESHFSEERYVAETLLVYGQVGRGNIGSRRWRSISHRWVKP